jgi:hypothetical protein
MNIIKEWWRDSADALNGTILAAIVIMPICVLIAHMAHIASEPALLDDDKAEAVKCACVCNHP